MSCRQRLAAIICIGRIIHVCFFCSSVDDVFAGGERLAPGRYYLAGRMKNAAGWHDQVIFYIGEGDRL